MNYNELKDIMKTRRSIRKFKGDRIPKEHIIEILECARWAPSATNSQPWKFIVISNKDAIMKIEESAQVGINNLKKLAKDIERDDIIRKIDVFSKYALVFKDAPSIVLCLAEPYSSKFTENIFIPISDKNQLWREEGIKSTCLAAQNIMLSAHALGYGTCALSGPMILAEKEIKSELGIEDKYSIALMIAIGIPDGKPNKTPRKGLEEIVEYID